MKNLVKLFLFSVILLAACKKEAITNSLFTGLDPSVKLPNADTTGAFAYIEGYIDGERFCLVSGKDSINFVDYASAMFGYDYQKEWVNGIGGFWYFEQPETFSKRWSVEFRLPTFGASRDVKEFPEFKKKYSTPGTFTNLDACSPTNNLDQFNLQINRTDDFDGKPNTLGLWLCGESQAGSFIKLVSVRKVAYYPGITYHYELIYEFDLKLTNGKHLTKGRMKTWVSWIKI